MSLFTPLAGFKSRAPAPKASGRVPGREAGVRDPWRDGPDFVPRPHQVVAVDAILAAYARGLPGFLLGDLTGLGKTLPAVLATAAMPWRSMLVVCPRGAMPQWRRTLARTPAPKGDRTIELVTPEGLRAFVARDGAAARPPRGKERTAGNREAARTGELLATFDVVVFDECHRMRNGASQQGRIARRLASASAFCLWISATAGQDPYELSYLGPLLGASVGMPGSGDAHFARVLGRIGIGTPGGAAATWRWRRDADAEAAMTAALFAPGTGIGLRRTPDDVEGWPAVQRELVPVALDRGEREAYAAGWRTFSREALAAGRGTTGRRFADAAKGLAATQRFRRLASGLRVGGTAEIASDVIESGLQAAISVAFVEVAAEMEARLSKAGHKVGVITGRATPAANEATRVAFQRGELDAVVFTVTESISLHQGEMPGGERPRALLVHDMRPSAIQVTQVEGRCHRDGRKAVVHYCYAEGTVEARVAAAAIGRMAGMASMQGDAEAGAFEELARHVDGYEGDW